MKAIVEIMKPEAVDRNTTSMLSDIAPISPLPPPLADS
jgi:hypothetical protein